jgi:glycine hydroxymethyltransferase
MCIRDRFRIYAKNVIDNAKILGETLVGHGPDLVSGGTDSHLLLVDLRKYGITGKDAAITLEHANITCNKNGIPFDPLPPMTTSGIRIGSPAATSRGFGQNEFKLVADLIADTLKGLKSGKAEKVIPVVQEQVLNLCSQFPIYQDL